MAELAIVTSCDERYSPLAKGLILSLRAQGFPRAGQQLCLLDIGCSDSTLQWMRDQGVHVVRLHPARHIPFPTAHLPSHVAAMAFRPFMRDVFPDFNVYLWIDADTWVQQGDSIELYHEAAKSVRHEITICPLIDVTYKAHFNARNFRQDLERIYKAIYGELGAKLSWLPVLGAGVFAMRRDSTIWDAWAAELPVVYSQDYSDVPEALHLCEQTALNRVCHASGKAMYLDAIHNYQLCAGSARWVNNQLTVAPRRTVGIVHLCCLNVYAKLYVDALAFFDRGRYLTAQELGQLRSLRKAG